MNSRLPIEPRPGGSSFDIDALDGESHRYRELFENAIDIVYTHDLSGRLTAVNRAAERLTGYSREELLELNITDLVTAEYQETARQMVLEQFGGGSSQRYVLALQGKGGQVIEAEVSVHLLFERGRPVGLMGFARDRTGHAREERARRKAEFELRDTSKRLERLSDYWKQLHRISTEEYAGISELALDCMAVGCEALGLTRALYAEVHESGFRVRAVFPLEASGPMGRFLSRESPALLQAFDAGETCLFEVETPHEGREFYEPGAAPLVVCAPVTVGSQVDGLLCFSGAPDPSQRLEAQSVAEFLAARMAGFLAEEKLIIARTDRLTGLWNRTAITERLDLAVRAAKQSGLRMAAVIIDVDLMAQFNDRHGHDAGDELLRLAGNRLSAKLSLGQEVGRMGADRFLAILPEVNSSNEALQTARELLRGIRKPFRILRREVSFSASAGVSVFPDDAGDVNGLLRCAESAMVSAKSRGRDDVERYSSGRPVPRSRRYEIEIGLQGALENTEFELLYQPQIKIDGSLRGFEILLAWDHPVFGRIAAGEFIPAAEESGLIVPIGAWVLREACQRLALWERAGHGRMNIAVNVSSVQFDRPDFVEIVAQTLLIHGVDPGQLELELTESAVMSNVTQSVKLMRQLRRIGVRLTIDDFGTGYSSLSYLTRLPVHTLKLDRSFLHDVDPPESALPTIRAIVALAHDLGMKVVGEGVEKFSQLKMLEGVGCDYIQGHLFGRPLPLEAATRLLEGRQGLIPPTGND